MLILDVWQAVLSELRANPRLSHISGKLGFKCIQVQGTVQCQYYLCHLLFNSYLQTAVVIQLCKVC